MNKCLEMTSAELSFELEKLSCSDGEASGATLREIFDRCFKLHTFVERTDLSSNSDQYQDAVRENIRFLENCTKMVNELSLFSCNENIEEVSTSDIRYLLLPALLGNLSMKVQPEELASRLEQIQKAELYFKDFLKRCRNYGVCDIDISELEGMKPESDFSEVMAQGSSDIISMTAERERKIQNYKVLKQLRNREDELKEALERPNAEDFIREYYLVLLERWILTSSEELDNIKKERKILEHSKQKKKDPYIKENGNSPMSKSFKPMIITKNDLQKKVFGIGYPSLPVLSIEDFYKQRFEKAVNHHKESLQEKTLQDMATNSIDMSNSRDVEEFEKEQKIEKDDPIALQKARDWDDWKDDNPRGSGNRKNKG